MNSSSGTKLLRHGLAHAGRTELHLNQMYESSDFGIHPHSKTEDKQRALQQFTKLQAAMKVLGISVEEQKALWLILGAIYHLGAAGATNDGDEGVEGDLPTFQIRFLTGRRQFARHEWAQKAAYLLGCTLDELSSLIFKNQARGVQPLFRGHTDDSGQGDSLGKNLQ
ncbi:hypothetical protein ILYODFUR_031860 [Ilyodon furcidens]|uniref:Myosin motor domain-containing protein n=1 Tax=Ilyodon furcidens TaxID=33524 RepID=A0ABV0SQT8_9TELE